MKIGKKFCYDECKYQNDKKYNLLVNEFKNLWILIGRIAPNLKELITKLSTELEKENDYTIFLFHGLEHTECYWNNKEREIGLNLSLSKIHVINNLIFKLCEADNVSFIEAHTIIGNYFEQSHEEIQNLFGVNIQNYYQILGENKENGVFHYEKHVAMKEDNQYSINNEDNANIVNLVGKTYPKNCDDSMEL